VSAAVPDFAQPFVGWRVWLLSQEPEGYRLKSLVHKVVWEPGRPLVASCLRRRRHLSWVRVPEEHESPDEGCECGVYATQIGMLGEYLHLGPIDRPLACAFGRVALWGTVLECERGWRASAAYPRHLYLPAERLLFRQRETPEAIAFDLAEYRVPIELVESDLHSALPELGRAAA
jgi:hypothetical protein